MAFPAGQVPMGCPFLVESKPWIRTLESQVLVRLASGRLQGATPSVPPMASGSGDTLSAGERFAVWLRGRGLVLLWLDLANPATGVLKKWSDSRLKAHARAASEEAAANAPELVPMFDGEEDGDVDLWVAVDMDEPISLSAEVDLDDPVELETAAEVAGTTAGEEAE
jgi:hypothetical protein